MVVKPACSKRAFFVQLFHVKFSINYFVSRSFPEITEFHPFLYLSQTETVIS